MIRAVRKGGTVAREKMSDEAVAEVARRYSAEIGAPIAAHDLRRINAKLAQV